MHTLTHDLCPKHITLPTHARIPSFFIHPNFCVSNFHCPTWQYFFVESKSLIIFQYRAYVSLLGQRFPELLDAVIPCAPQLICSCLYYSICHVLCVAGFPVSPKEVSLCTLLVGWWLQFAQVFCIRFFMFFWLKDREIFILFVFYLFASSSWEIEIKIEKQQSICPCLILWIVVLIFRERRITAENL